MSLFLAAAATSSRFKQVVRRLHRRQRTASVLASLTSIAPFMGGAFVAYFAVALWMGPEGTALRFDHVVSSVGLEPGPLTGERFEQGFGLLGHNVLVMLSVFVLGFVYRAFGALLTLFWNASAWAITLVILAQASAADGSWQGGAAVIVAVFPHLFLEGLAFIAVALAGVRLGTSMSRADLVPAGRLAVAGLRPRRPRFRARADLADLDSVDVTGAFVDVNLARRHRGSHGRDLCIRRDGAPARYRLER
ncbi:MAG: stage II sporulation protein M [Deltaproteobacteria bacterium]|nr:stage II sporulation protein M [Deltaproteobacteria bacterium]